MITSAADREERLGSILRDVTHLMRRNFDRRARSLNLTQVQWRALTQLSTNPGVSQTELAELLETEPESVCRLVDRLEAAGWVERRQNPKDRRAFQLFVSARGRPLLAHLWRFADETHADAIDGLSPEALHMLVQTLQHVKRNLANAEKRPAKTARATVKAG